MKSIKIILLFPLLVVSSPVIFWFGWDILHDFGWTDRKAPGRETFDRLRRKFRKERRQ